jgi:hypothetical protein
MALFAGQPAGIQIRKWLVILVSLIVVINVLAAGSLFLLQRSLTAIEGKYQPVLIVSGTISTEVHQAQASLYKYLGEYLDSTAEVESRTEALEKTLLETADLTAAGEWREELEAIQDSLAKYRVVIRNLPAIGEGTDWDEVDEMRTQAMVLGREMEGHAAGLREGAGERIGLKALQSLRMSRIAIMIFLCLLMLSAVITALLLVWWRQFQDMILNL